jgi:large subunit ribosomal protein L6
MSRIGKKDINVPDKIKIEIKDDIVKISGPKGNLEEKIPSGITIKQENGNLKFERSREDKKTRSNHGLARQLVNNMVIGVKDGFVKELEIIGVGYRAQLKGKILNLQLGYSNPIEFELPEAVNCEMDGNTKIKLTSYNKQLLGQIAADIRKLRPPEVYKGKGIRYKGEYVRKKAGKTTK